MPKPSTVDQPLVVCITGMHRTGTSLTARVLNLIGIHLGSEEQFKTPTEDNPTGFWEHQDLSLINEAIFETLGGSWHEPPQLPGGWETARVMDDLKERAQSVIADQFSEFPIWGWKDPRNCLTLPFWHRIIPEMRYVICVRNPVDVAQSLNRRDGFSAEKTSSLWFKYVNSALALTEGKRRLVVFYEDLMNDPVGELYRLAEFVDMPEQADRIEVQEAVKDFAQKELQHYQTALVQTVASPRIGVPAKALYAALRISAGLGNKASHRPVQSDDQIEKALNILGQYSSKVAGEPNPLIEQLAVLEARLADSNKMIPALRAKQEEATTLAGLLEESQLGAQTLLVKLAAQDRVFQALESQILERDRTIQTLSSSLSEEVRVARAQAEQAEETTADLSAQLLEVRNQLEQIKNTRGWRLLSFYGRLKFAYLLPVYRLAAMLTGKRVEPQHSEEGGRRGVVIRD